MVDRLISQACLAPLNYSALGPQGIHACNPMQLGSEPKGTIAASEWTEMMSPSVGTTAMSPCMVAQRQVMSRRSSDSTKGEG